MPVKPQLNEKKYKQNLDDIMKYIDQGPGGMSKSGVGGKGAGSKNKKRKKKGDGGPNETIQLTKKDLYMERVETLNILDATMEMKMEDCGDDSDPEGQSLLNKIDDI